jgi:hypothetical protein
VQATARNPYDLNSSRTTDLIDKHNETIVKLDFIIASRAAQNGFVPRHLDFVTRVGRGSNHLNAPLTI